jgi:hypothetical protein
MHFHIYIDGGDTPCKCEDHCEVTRLAFFETASLTVVQDHPHPGNERRASGIIAEQLTASFDRTWRRATAGIEGGESVEISGAVPQEKSCGAGSPVSSGV